MYKDTDGDTVYDAGEPQVGGAGVMSITAQLGTITFTGDFLSTSSKNYILVADWTVPTNGSFLSIGLVQSGVSISDTIGAETIYGSVTSVHHNRNNKTGGVTPTIGGEAPSGAGIVSGGTSGGGISIDTNAGGQTIGNDPSFFWPTSQTGSWNNGANAFDQIDGTYASTNGAVTHSYYDHGFSIPVANSITGIELKLEVSGTTAAGAISAELSWNGGSSWSSSRTTPTLSTTDTVRSLGGPSDLWGHSWIVSEFSNANFRVRVTGAPSSNTVQIDAIQARIYHQTNGGGGGGGGEI